MPSNLRCALRTPARPGAIAIIELTGDVNAAATALDLRLPEVGSFHLASICGIDKGVIARWSEDTLHLMPHGGAHIVKSVMQALHDHGVETFTEKSDRALAAFTDADVEQAALDALSRASSSLAIDLLLDQPRRWAAWNRTSPTTDEVRTRAHALNRLLDPPLVIAIGATNIGKSTLVNALAQRSVALVADEPGVTRDHVGVSLDMAGLTVRWLDTPGLRADESEAGALEAEAARITRDLLPSADLLVLCADPGASFDLPEQAVAGATVPMLHLGLRSDLGPIPGADLTVTAGGPQPAGVGDLALAMRRMLVPDEDLAWNGPWRFDSRLMTPRKG